MWISLVIFVVLSLVRICLLSKPLLRPGWRKLLQYKYSTDVHRLDYSMTVQFIWANCVGQKSWHRHCIGDTIWLGSINKSYQIFLSHFRNYHLLRSLHDLNKASDDLSSKVIQVMLFSWESLVSFLYPNRLLFVQMDFIFLINEENYLEASSLLVDHKKN